VSNTKDLADRPRPLPVQVPLRPGESVDAFIRRLATANHLRPSYLRTYLNHPPGTIGQLQLTRLALVTGRTVHALTHVFPGLDPTRRPTAPNDGGQRQRDDPAPPDVATMIRIHAGRDELVNRLSRHFVVHRQTVIKALTGQPPHTRRQAPTYPILAPHLGQITDLLAQNPNVTCMSVWKTLTQEHHADVSYATVRSYLFQTRVQPVETWSAQHLTRRARLFERIRIAAGEDLVTRLATRLCLPSAVVLQALQDDAALPVRPTPPPAPTLTGPQRHRKFAPDLRAAVDAMVSADPHASIREIWTRLVEDHHADVSYDTVGRYVARAHPSPARRPRSKPRPRVLTTQTRVCIDQIVLASPTASVRQIWAHLIDDYALDASYATVREYVARQRRPASRRSATPDTARTTRTEPQSGAGRMRRPEPIAAPEQLG
jgi:hypothetical protein